MTGRRKRPVRDQAESPFNLILEDFLSVARFARGAAIVDYEGETVDYGGELDPFELRVAGATFQLVLMEARECKVLRPIQITMAMGRAGYLLRVLDPSYCLLVVLRKLGTFCVSDRLLLELEARILTEASLPLVRRPAFFRVEVETQGAGARVRPARLRRPPGVPGSKAVGLDWMPLEVLGALVGLAPGERAFRVRLPSGAETTLTRDTSRLWFTDYPVEALMKKAGPSTKLFLQPPPPRAGVKPPARSR